MNRLDKCKLAIEKGYSYNSETGDIIGPNQNPLKRFGGNGYLAINLKIIDGYTNLYHHQFAWYCIYGDIVECLDHINGDRTDNRIINLRSVTNQQNLYNQKDAKGYHWCKSKNKWRASIRINGKKTHIGYYINKEDARKAYLNAKLIYHIID